MVFSKAEAKCDLLPAFHQTLFQFVVGRPEQLMFHSRILTKKILMSFLLFFSPLPPTIQSSGKANNLVDRTGIVGWKILYIFTVFYKVTLDEPGLSPRWVFL